MWPWEIVRDDWWRTSFRTISWAHKTKPDLARPPHYQDRLARGRRKRVPGDALEAARGQEEDVSLSDGLCGVQAAEESLKRYELEVAILPSDSSSNPSTEPPCCPEHRLSKEVWAEKVQELFGGILEQGPLPEVDSLSSDISLWDLKHLEEPFIVPRSPGRSDLTDSGSSVESDPPPSTPKPTKASYARVVSNESPTGPTVFSPVPSKLLNASALTFIPSTPQRESSREPTTPPLTSSSNSSDSPFSSPTYNFHFPSLNSASPADRKESRSLPPSLQKDESGFYVEVPDDAGPGVTQSLNGTRSTTPRRPSAAFLPAFLTDGSPTARSRNSKTREIVDRIRSSGSSSSGRKAKKSDRNRKPSVPMAKDADLAGLVSEPGSSAKSEEEGWISAVVSQDSSTRSLVTDDGWVLQTTTIPPPVPQVKSSKHGHGHKRSSGSTSQASTFSPASSTTSIALPPTPAMTSAGPHLQPPVYPTAAPMPYPTGAYPGAYGHSQAGAYMPPQLPYPAGRGPWPAMGFQPGMYPMYQPFGVVPGAVPYGMMPVAPLQPAPVFFDGKVKPAGSALVQWYVPPRTATHVRGVSDRSTRRGPP